MLRLPSLLPLILVSAWLAGVATAPFFAATVASDPSARPALPSDLTALLGDLSDPSQLPLPPLDPEVPAPQTLLGHPLGSRLSHWATIRDYFALLADASERVTTWNYGSTYEGRPPPIASRPGPGQRQPGNRWATCCAR